MTEPTQPAGPAALTGKRIRLGRLIDPAPGSCRIVALDHGMTSPRFLEGLTDTAAKVRESVNGGANVLMLGRGIAGECWQAFAGRASLALMLTAAAAAGQAVPRSPRSARSRRRSGSARTRSSCTSRSAATTSRT